MATYNQTGFYTTVNDTLPSTDLGQLFFDCSYNQTIGGVKNYVGQVICSQVPTQGPN